MFVENLDLQLFLARFHFPMLDIFKTIREVARSIHVTREPNVGFRFRMAGGVGRAGSLPDTG